MNNNSTMSNRIETLDMVRGICAILVVIYHFLSWENIAVYESLGTFPVYIFFILSALTMSHVYNQKFSAQINQTELRRYFLNRFARLLPLLLTISLIMGILRVLAYKEIDIDNITRTFLTATGLFSLHLPGMMSNTVGAWSLGIELLFYFLFPVLIVTLPQRSTKVILIILCILALGQNLTILKVSQFEKLVYWNSYATPIVFGPFFFIGILIHSIGRSETTFKLLGSLFCILIIAVTSIVFHGSVIENLLVFNGLSAISGLSIYFAYNASLPKSLSKVATFLGVLSYPLYLTQWLSYKVSMYLAKLLGNGITTRVIIFCTIAILTAYMANILIEKPSQRWIKRRLGKQYG